MAWLESHQTLANHPKTLKLARLLNVPRVTAVGHLHFLWWWALDYAQDGDLSKFDEMDVAVAADWQGEPELLLAGLKRAGFVDEDGRIHDWYEYTGRLIERRRADADRKREARSKDVQRPSGGHPEDGVRNRTVPYPTEPNPTEPPPVDGADAPEPKPKRATAIDPEWDTSPELWKWALDEGYAQNELRTQLKRFRDHFTANGKPMKDWDAAFRNWMRRSREFGAPRAGPQQRDGIGQGRFSSAVEAMEGRNGPERNGASIGHDRDALLAHGPGSPGPQPGNDGIDLAVGAGGRAVDAVHRVRPSVVVPERKVAPASE